MRHDDLAATFGRVRDSASVEEAANRVAAAACVAAGWGAALLTIAVPTGVVVGHHALSSEEVRTFRRRAAMASLAERHTNRAHLASRAFPGTRIAFVPAGTSGVYVRPTPEARAGLGDWLAEDALFVLVPGCTGDIVGVLSLDGPPDGRRPTAGTLGPLVDAELLVGMLGPLLEARLLFTAIADRDAALLDAQRHQVLGHVATEVAHDLNNLLSAILGATELAHELSTNPAVQGLLDDALRAAARAGDLGYRLLTLGAELPSGATSDLSAVVDGHARMLARLLAEDGVALRVDAHNPVRVSGEPTQLLQILLNLVMNARDAAPRTGVRVVTEAFEEHGTRFGALVVIDDGEGMTAEVLARLFEPHFTTKPHGTGIGLSSVKRLVERLHGRTKVSSEPGRGTTFRVELPAAPA